jgi:predicted ATPase/DNA-binding winged helix-turn-helix (wHTH) protein
MTGVTAPKPSVRFGEFEFMPGRRRLERDGVVVELSSRAMDILAVLTERPGEIITKLELLKRVWPDALVVDAALRSHMVGLRRSLGDGEEGGRLITTVPGRGYCFVGELESPSRAAEGSVSPPRAAPRPLPRHPTKVVGRDTVVEDLTRQLELQRFVTIVGPGGIGKTTVALMAAHRWEATHSGATVFVDLGDLDPESPESVAEALCATLGLAPQGISAQECVHAHLRSSEALIVLDTCEGVIEAAARLAESLAASAPGVRVLATSREALRAEGEFVNRIGPLAAPPHATQLTAREALTYPAVRLFVQRVAANHAGFELGDAHASIVAAICRELDGMALAIELAAGRVDAFGIQRVADLLATEFALTWPGRRTAAPRQQTLRATLNWSHELLGPVERAVFRRLSVLVGAYPLEAAIAVCTDGGGLAEADVIDALPSLVAKSLLNTVVESPTNHFRMLDTTRSYALVKLAESGDEQATRLRQAEYYLGRLTAIGAEQDEPAAGAEVVANVSAALGWAFSAQGDPSIGIRLTAAAAGLWVRHGLLAECRKWTPVAQARLDDDPAPSDLNTRLVLVSALLYTDGIAPEGRLDCEAAYANAIKQGRLEERLSGLIALWADQHRGGRYAAAERLIDEADFLEAPDASPAHRLTAVWLRGVTDHRAGRHAQACKHLTRLLREYTEASGREFLRLGGYDLEVAGANMLGLSEFLRGNLDKAFSSNDRAIGKARTLSSPVSLKAALRHRTVMIYFFDEDSIELDRLTGEILPSEAIGDVDGPDGAALAIRGFWLARNGDWAQGAEMVRQGVNAGIKSRYTAMRSLVRAETGLQLLRHGAEELIDEFVAPLEDDEEEDGWATPEVLRIRGEIAERRGDLARAESRYREALALAERQDALTWRLRSAISLADLWLARGRPEDAAALLAPIHGQFPSGVDWPLLRRAAGCLSACRAASGSRPQMGDKPLERG